MNAPLDVPYRQPHPAEIRLAILREIVEEMGTSQEHRTPEECPVIRTAAAILGSLGLAQEAWTTGEVAILLGVTVPTAQGLERNALTKLRRMLRCQRAGIVDDLRAVASMRDARETTLPEAFE